MQRNGCSRWAQRRNHPGSLRPGVSLLFALGALHAAAADAQDGASAAVDLPQIPRSTASVQIDGVLDDNVWENALVVELTNETQPGENVPASVETTAYLVEDGTRLLLAFDARDPDPSSIRAYLRDRDTAFNDDFVGIVIDSFGDQRYGYEFFANALGVQMDLTNDDVNRNESDSWDAIWDSAGRINDRGFVVEMAIPFSQLRFAPTDGERVWGIDVLRFRPRSARERISNNEQDRGRNCYLCQFERVRGPADVEPSKNLEIVPSLTTSRTDSRANPVVDPMQKGDSETEAGLNVRWAVTQNLTTNLALNPDFSQVEADVAQLDVNNQFALFYPESRPFFLEGADYFSTPMSAVFTRTVADPDVGAKLTGQIDDNTLGVFGAADAVTNLLFPSPLTSQSQSLEQDNDAFVGRYARSVGSNSQIGALLTSRSGDDYHNDVYGVDGRLRFGGRHSVQFQYLHSDTEYPFQTATDFEQPHGDFAGDASELRYRFNQREWEVDLAERRYDSGFRADSGFITRVGVDQQEVEAQHIWQRGSRPWNQIRAGVNSNVVHDSSGRLLDENVEAVVSFNGPMQSFIQFGGGPSKRFWGEQNPFGTIVSGELYSGSGAFVFSQIRPRGGLNVQILVRQGDTVDFANSRLGYETRVRPNVEWNINRHLLLRMQHTAVRFDTQEGEKIFDADLTDLRVTWQFNVRSFLRFTTQRQLVTRNQATWISDIDAETLTIGTQLLYSYKLNPQTVLYAGYSDNIRDDDDLLEATRLNRTFFAKVSYAWLK